MPLGPADPDMTDVFLREVMGCTDEMLEQLSRDAARRRAAEEEQAAHEGDTARAVREGRRPGRGSGR